jgi:lysozyme family protein
MISSARSSRRTFVAGAVATGTLLATGLPSPLIAQTVKLDDWKRLAAMVEEARKLGVSTPLVSVPDATTAKFEEILPPLVDLIDDLNDGPTAAKPEVVALLARAKALLTEINRRERPARKSDLEPGGWLGAFITAANAQDNDPATRYQRYRKSYIDLFDTCKIRPERLTQVEWYVDKISSAKYRSQYEKLEDQICVPWYVIGVMHALEASFNFDTHLHNGDPLTGRTYHVPAGRPAEGSPPFDWATSAKDALGIKNYINRTDWHVASTLFRIEAYNGFRSREIYKINSPYLWSFSNHYTKGKFVEDNEWDGNAVSAQCGAAVILKVLTDRKIIQMIA